MYYILIILSSILYIIINIKKYTKVLQQNYYNENNRYLKWCIKNIKNIKNIGIILILIINIINISIKSKVLIILNILYIIIYLKENKKQKNEQQKLPFKITARVKRLFITDSLLLIGIIILLQKICNIYIFSTIYSVLMLLISLIVYISNVINKPIEKIVFYYYYNKTTTKLKKLNNLEIIGITGSCGKTTTKNILNDILNVKYNSKQTPKSFNTLYGLMITIDKELNKYNDFFIAEMGAFKKGEIKKITKMIKPKYGIITNIGTAHLETFKTRENIQKGKFELIESLPNKGVAILNRDDPYQTSYKLKNKCDVIWIGINNEKANISAKNIKMDETGMTFDVTFKEEQKDYEFKTKILGKENIYNILSAIAFCKYKGMTIEEIKYGVKKVKPSEHRLELREYQKNTIIDDSYNSNPNGAKMALEVLDIMKGIKIVVTPGMIELGKNENEINEEYGKQISKVADYVILVGKNKTKPIYNGLLKENFNKEKIIVINDVKEAFKIVKELKEKEKKYILLENDLPDIFNE